MFKFIRERIAVKVTLCVNILLFAVMLIGAFIIIHMQGTNIENSFMEKGRMESVVGAKMIGTIIDEAIDNGVFSIKDAFDTEYEPIPGFEPPKYHTRYDSYLDKAILGIQDEFLKDTSIIFAAAVDINGYVPTHNTKFNAPLTKDRKKDLNDNRTKRIFNDSTGLAAARNNIPGFIQTYKRDTGEIIWDISTPVLVKGKQWGGFRIGLSLEKIKAEKKRMMLTLILTMAAILAISFIAVFFSINRVLAPIGKLTTISSKLADGNIEHKIKPETNDEIGKLADVLERLRVSLKVAMERIAQKK